MIAHYDGSRGLLSRHAASGHAACVAYWKGARNAHINGNGWSDIGYAYFVCPDRKVFVGRGYGHQQAAELPTSGKLQNGNVRYISVTFGTGPGERPTDDQLKAWADLREWYLTEKNGLQTVYGHRDFTSTDCPGDVIFHMTRDGTLKATAIPDVTPTPEGDLLSSMPMLKVGDRSTAVLSLRALLFERWLSARWANDSTGLYTWLREQAFTPDLRVDVIAYQKDRFPDDSSQWDGIVGPLTWGKLLQVV
jgi:hypothetical protein